MSREIWVYDEKREKGKKRAMINEGGGSQKREKKGYDKRGGWDPIGVFCGAAQRLLVV